jgi:hypothetical protein
LEPLLKVADDLGLVAVVGDLLEVSLFKRAERPVGLAWRAASKIDSRCG